MCRKEKNVMANEIAGFGSLKFKKKFILSELIVKCVIIGFGEILTSSLC